MTAPKNQPKVQFITIAEEAADQRIDNFLITQLKGVPRSHIYRVLRKGEVRVNKKRAKPLYRLQAGDVIRIPPLFLAEKAKTVPPSQRTLELLQQRILYEDDALLIINKPSGMSVHAGSTVRLGVIEALRQLYPKLTKLELAHRLDSETSGCLILAKKRSVLKEIHALLRDGKVNKIYWTLTMGHWFKQELKVDLPLLKKYDDHGQHLVKVSNLGKQALSEFRLIKKYAQSSLMEVKLLTGRTHQIRVHAQHSKHPIAGDDRYGDPAYNKRMHALGLKRMFLHAQSVAFYLPSLDKHIKVSAPLDLDLQSLLDSLGESE